MRVALDARSMQTQPLGGVGRSLTNLVPHLRDHADLTFLTDSRLPPLDTDLPQVPLRGPLRGASISWVQWSAAQWLRQWDGIVHGPFYVLPLALAVPGVVSLHDISWEHHPEWFSRSRRLSFAVQARRAAQRAAVVITGSEFVKRDLVETYQIDPAKILLAGHGVDPVFRPQAHDPILLDRLGVTQSYVLALGGAARRNLPVAVEAWRLARRQGLEVQLVVAGKERPAPEPGLVYAGFASDTELAALMAGAAAFVYPTEYEGFGMPALEAMGSGTVVVAAPVTSLPEVLGDAAAWAESTRASDLADSLVALFSEPNRQTELRTRSLSRAAALPGWDEAAEVHLEAYRRADAVRR
jgi:glycosyltransferase involved in cell wall biosynthesis